jgi:hypothetical protein
MITDKGLHDVFTSNVSRGSGYVGCTTELALIPNADNAGEHFALSM